MGTIKFYDRLRMHTYLRSVFACTVSEKGCQRGTDRAGRFRPGGMVDRMLSQRYRPHRMRFMRSATANACDCVREGSVCSLRSWPYCSGFN